MKRKLIYLGLFLLFSLTIWYFLVKKSDYTITFTAKTSSGTVYQGINEWMLNLQKSEQCKVKSLTHTKFKLIDYFVDKGEESFYYSWSLSPISDSTTKVILDIKSQNNSFYHRLLAPFFSTEFKEYHINQIKEFRAGLEKHLEKFKVKIEGIGQTEELFVAYITLNSVQQEKAQKMIFHDPEITGYLAKNKIEIIGKPYLEIVNWDVESEQLTFNYCFPIQKNTPYVADEKVKFKTIPPINGLKATYFGNYRTSDRAWFALLDYAERNTIQLKLNPLENFLANPFYGGDELSWETKIIIPIVKE